MGQYNCFCVAVSDDHKAAYVRVRTGGDIAVEVPRHSQRRLARRFLGKIFTHSALSPYPNIKEKVRKESSRSLASKGLDLGGEDDQKSASIFSSNSAAASSSSSSSSSSSPSPSSPSSSRSLAAMVAIPELEEPRPGQNWAPPLSTTRALEARNPALLLARICPSPRGMLMLVGSLSVMVFFGRMWAIFWTSLWFYLVACLFYGGNGVAEADEEGESRSAAAEVRP